MIRTAAMVAFPLSVGIAAAAAGSLSLFALALGFVVLCAGSVAMSGVGARRAVVVRTIDRHEALEDHPITMKFAVTGLTGLPLRVEIRGDDGKWHQLDAAGGSTEVVVDRPGAHMLAPSPLRLRDELGLISRRIAGGEPQALLILPAPETPTHARFAAGAEQAGDPEPDGLRPYVPGTPMSRIHWAASARGAELQERHFVTARDGLPLVVVDTAGVTEDAAIDWVARAAAGYVLALVRQGGCRVALPGDRLPVTVVDQSSEWPALHRRLAALEAGESGFQPAATERDVIWLRAAAAPADALHQRGELPRGVVALSDWVIADR